MLYPTPLDVLGGSAYPLFPPYYVGEAEKPEEERAAGLDSFSLSFEIVTTVMSPEVGTFCR